MIEESESLPFAAIAERIATLAGVPVEVEERPARVAGGAVRLSGPPAVSLAFEGPLSELLNLVAERTGYEWAYWGDPLDRRDPLDQGDLLDRRDPLDQGDPLWAEGGIVFYRYHDVEQRMPGMMRATPGGQGQLSAAAAVRPQSGASTASGTRPCVRWCSKNGAHGRAGPWCGRPGRDYAVRADAVFEGGFLDAVDRLLAAPATRRSLVAFAHEPNRYLVIEPAGAL